MSRTKKKAPAKRRKAPVHVPRRLAARLWRYALLVTGLVLGALLPWLIWLDHVVTSEFEGRKWDLPSRVYARPLSLYPGLQISHRALQEELELAGYLPQAQADRPGTYARSGDSFRIHRRPFSFDDGRQQALSFQLQLKGGEVASLEDSAGTGRLVLVRLDPAEIASIFPLDDEDRTLVSINEVPGLLVTGLQAVEDRNFKHHHGLHFRGIGRAVLANIRAGKTVQGGSTLTQQLVKNYYLNNDRTLSRKINEAFMSLLLELHYSKSQILEAYLNEIYLGQQGRHGIHGFGRGSEFYFGQPLGELDTHQIALLVGLVQGASLYNPRRNPARALELRNRVLDVFATTGLIPQAEAATAKSRPLGVTASPQSGGSRYPAFIDLVRRQLRNDYQEDDLRSEGLRIFTTLAPFEQAAAERAVITEMKGLADRGLPATLQAALVLAEVGNGEVRALVGSRLPAAMGFNRALDARRQVGSVIKPLVYLGALEHSDDYNLLTMVKDEPIPLRQPDGSVWSPDNSDGQSHGELTLLSALTHSYNQATVRVGMHLGVQHLLSKLQQMGISVPVEPVPAALLGAVELTPFEVTQIYQSLAAGGFTVPLRSVIAVQTASGETLNRYPLRMMPLPDRSAVAVLNYALTQVVETGTARALPGLLGSAVTIAGKTGTTNERRDSWFVGYTRDRVAVSWVGQDDNTPAGVTGGSAAMQLWAGLFRSLPLNAVDLDMPEGAYWVWVNPGAHALSDESCPGAVQLPFVAGSEPRVKDGCLERLGRETRKSLWRKLFDD